MYFQVLADPLHYDLGTYLGTCSSSCWAASWTSCDSKGSLVSAMCRQTGMVGDAAGGSIGHSRNTSWFLASSLVIMLKCSCCSWNRSRSAWSSVWKGLDYLTGWESFLNCFLYLLLGLGTTAEPGVCVSGSQTFYPVLTSFNSSL